MAQPHYLYLQGKAKWVRTTAPDPWGNWKMDLYFNPESKSKWNQAKEEFGLLNNTRTDADGDFITLKRPMEKKRRDGRTFGFAPPEVLQSDGTTPLRDTLVGNGSDVTAKVSIYQYNKPGGGKGHAARWEAIRVDNLIPYDGKRDFDGDAQKQVGGLSEQPEHMF